MDSSRKQIINQIAFLDKSLKYQQAKVQWHKQKIETFVSSKDLSRAAVILGLICSWKLIKSKNVGQLIKKISEFGMVMSTAYFKNKILKMLVSV